MLVNRLVYIIDTQITCLIAVTYIIYTIIIHAISAFISPIPKTAIEVLGDDILRKIAVEIAEKIKSNASLDWTIRESARAKIMVIVRRVLNKYGYPPDKQQQAIYTVLKQAALTTDKIVYA